MVKRASTSTTLLETVERLVGRERATSRRCASSSARTRTPTPPALTRCLEHDGDIEVVGVCPPPRSDRRCRLRPRPRDDGRRAARDDRPRGDRADHARRSRADPRAERLTRRGSQRAVEALAAGALEAMPKDGSTSARSTARRPSCCGAAAACSPARAQPHASGAREPDGAAARGRGRAVREVLGIAARRPAGRRRSALAPRRRFRPGFPIPDLRRPAHSAGLHRRARALARRRSCGRRCACCGGRGAERGDLVRARWRAPGSWSGR